MDSRGPAARKQAGPAVGSWPLESHTRPTLGQRPRGLSLFPVCPVAPPSTFALSSSRKRGVRFQMSAAQRPHLSARTSTRTRSERPDCPRQFAGTPYPRGPSHCGAPERERNWLHRIAFRPRRPPMAARIADRNDNEHEQRAAASKYAAPGTFVRLPKAVWQYYPS